MILFTVAPDSCVTFLRSRVPSGRTSRVTRRNKQSFHFPLIEAARAPPAPFPVAPPPPPSPPRDELAPLPLNHKRLRMRVVPDASGISWSRSAVFCSCTHAPESDALGKPRPAACDAESGALPTKLRPAPSPSHSCSEDGGKVRTRRFAPGLGPCGSRAR